MDVLFDRSRSLLIIYSPSCLHGLCYVSYCFINIFNHSRRHIFFCHHLWCFRTFPCTWWELAEDYGRFEMADIKTMVSRHCGRELPYVLAANKKRSKLTSTLLCCGQVTLKYLFISIIYLLFLSRLINNNMLSSEEWSWQLWMQFMQLRKRSLKKIQDFNGIWTRDLAIPNTWPAPNISGFIA